MKTNYTCALALGILLNSAASADIKIFNPWIKTTEGSNAALYMKIVNTSDKPAELVKVEANGAKMTELHAHTRDGENEENAHVTKVSFFKIPQKGNWRLEPGGSQVMLKDIAHPLKPGENVPVRLHFTNGQNITLNVPVKD